jgi:hypothetical protein
MHLVAIIPLYVNMAEPEFIDRYPNLILVSIL